MSDHVVAAGAWCRYGYKDGWNVLSCRLVTALLYILNSVASSYFHHKDIHVESAKLQSINKVMILSIRKIQPLLILQPHIPRTLSDSRLPLILLSIPQPNTNEKNKTHTITHNDGNFSRNESRPILRPESLRSFCMLASSSPILFNSIQLTDYIPSTIPNQIHRRNSSFLRIPGNIRRNQRQKSHERRWTCLSKIITDQTTDVIG